MRALGLHVTNQNKTMNTIEIIVAILTLALVAYAIKDSEKEWWK